MNFLITILLFSISYVSKNETGKIYYTKEHKITWNDFKVKRQLDEAASVETAISYDYSIDGKVEVYCILYKGSSYVKPGVQSAYLLNHEQRHFDLTFIYAMKFTNELKKLPNPSESQISNLYQRVVSEWDKEQDKYDLETDNSINTEKQEQWDKIIDNKLSEL